MKSIIHFLKTGLLPMDDGINIYSLVGGATYLQISKLLDAIPAQYKVINTLEDSATEEKDAVRIYGSDNVEFIVARKYALQLTTIKNMLEGNNRFLFFLDRHIIIIIIDLGGSVVQLGLNASRLQKVVVTAPILNLVIQHLKWNRIEEEKKEKEKAEKQTKEEEEKLAKDQAAAAKLAKNVEDSQSSDEPEDEIMSETEVTPVFKKNINIYMILIFF